MTIPMLPIGGQISSLLRSAKRQAGLLEDEEDPTVGAPPAALPFGQMPQQMQAPQMQGGQMPASDAHAHKEGLLGRLGHAFGGDRIQPEVAALLTPDQQSRVRRGAGGALWDYLARGETTSEAQQRRAGEMLTLGDTKQARQTAATQNQRLQALQAQVSQMPVGQERTETFARGMAEIFPTAPNATQLVVGLKDREFAPQRETWTTVPMMVDGQQTMVMRSNLGQLLDASNGRDLRAVGAKMEPMPQQAPPNQILPSINPDGTPGYTAVSGRGGEVTVTPVRDVTRPDTTGRTTAAVRAQVASNRSQIGVIDHALAELEKYPEAVGLTRIAGDKINQRVDPRGVPARAALSNIGSLRIHDRSGAAVTAKEFPRLSPFIPNVSDTYEKVKSNLEAMRRELENETAELERGAPSASSPPTGKMMTQAEFNRLSPAAQQAARAGGYTITP